MQFKLVSLVFAASALSISAQTTAWNSLGCVAEGTFGTRYAFAGSATTSGNMTVQNCLNSCPLNYAGLENGSQCFCSDTIMNNGASGTPISPNFCNAPCSGNDTEKCGGILSLTVYTRHAVPANGWITAGCYVDSNESRAL
ncbi:hypothetical protein BDQ12DRAFT_728496 [Crucibulum laeve]|uniref:WSC domain-containing protein n=1 Tax=Crucibulum laeve TaxID=68775 RepID=A0A5C3LIH0_9AGAR|nr:hypothetical protein BDQ12DRAFT_728496 [Crucibulum laeve]